MHKKKSKRINSNALGGKTPSLLSLKPVEIKEYDYQCAHCDRAYKSTTKPQERDALVKAFKLTSGLKVSFTPHISIKDSIVNHVIPSKLVHRILCSDCMAVVRKAMSFPKPVAAKSDRRIYGLAHWENTEELSEALLERMTPDDFEYLRRMPYKKFLNTFYWRLVRSIKLKACGRKCQCCGCISKLLHIHHKTYEHRGREIFHLDDLEVICKDCHAKEH